jgi:predicted Rossmann fold nucleotide-binding protein DprA/Smf involved in DNA uptake
VLPPRSMSALAMVRLLRGVRNQAPSLPHWPRHPQAWAAYADSPALVVLRGRMEVMKSTIFVAILGSRFANATST